MAFKKKFTLAGATSIPATADFVSDKIDIDKNYVWLVTPKATGIVGGPPTYSVEVSADDGATWKTYTGAGGLAIAADFEADKLAYTSMRINYLNNVTTAGNVEFQLTLKRN